MEYRTVSTKLPVNELTLFRAHCEKKGISPAQLIRELILKEMKIIVPHVVAGKNKITYNRNKDSFTWSIKLDSGKTIKILNAISPNFIESLSEIIQIGLEERRTFIHKKNRDSVPIPSNILGQDNV